MYQNWTLETLDPIKAIKSLLTSIQEDVVAMKVELRELFNEQINFKRLNSKQKIAIIIDLKFSSKKLGKFDELQ